VVIRTVITTTPMRLTHKINPVIIVLMISDSVVYTGFGLFEPFLAVYVGEIHGGSIASAGVAAAIHLVVKSLLQLPFSRYVDATEHKDPAKGVRIASTFLWIGAAIMTAVPFGFYFSTLVWHVYVLQALYGVGGALAYPTWLKLWQRHLDRAHESFEWTLYSTLVSLMSAGAAVLGGILADTIGFRSTFLVAGVVVALGGAVLIGLKRRDRAIASPIKM